MRQRIRWRLRFRMNRRDSSDHGCVMTETIGDTVGVPNEFRDETCHYCLCVAVFYL